MTNHPNGVTVANIPLDFEDRTRVVERIVGLDDGAPVRLDMPTRSQQDGRHDATDLRDARVITVEGFISEGTSETMRTLDDMRALRGLLELVVESQDRGVRMTEVRVSSALETTWIGDDSCTYTWTFTAPDPLLYGEAFVSQTTLASSAGGTGRVWSRVWPRDWGVPEGVTPGSIALPNEGTAPYWPVLRLDGPVTNPVLAVPETGDRLAIAYAIQAGQWLDIDCGKRRVLLNGQSSLRPLTTSTGSWLAIPPGGGSISLTADSGGAECVLTARGYEGAWS